MTRVLLVRHGRTTANASGVLAGRMPGVHLDDVGIQQAKAIAQLLSAVPISTVAASPLVRTVETAKIIRSALRQEPRPQLIKDRAFIECDYGTWTGKKLKKLAKDPLWAAVQAHPASVTFPEGESMLAAQSRAVEGLRQLVRRSENGSGTDSVVLIVSHGDVIKSVVADALGMHLDMFQRLVIDPGSVTAIDYTPMRPFVRMLNVTNGVAAGLSAGVTKSPDAAIGGGAGR